MAEEAIVWVATERGREIHITEISLGSANVLLIEGGILIMRDINKPGEAVNLGEPLSFASGPEIFKQTLALTLEPGERAVCHPLDGPDYYLFKAGEG